MEIGKRTFNMRRIADIKSPADMNAFGKAQSMLSAAHEIKDEVFLLDGPKGEFGGVDKNPLEGVVFLNKYKLEGKGRESEILPEVENIRQQLTGGTSTNDEGVVTGMSVSGPQDILSMALSDDGTTKVELKSFNSNSKGWSTTTVTANMETGDVTYEDGSGAPAQQKKQRHETINERVNREIVTNGSTEDMLNRIRYLKLTGQSNIGLGGYDGWG